MTTRQRVLLQQLVDDYRRSSYVFPEELIRRAVALQARHLSPPYIAEADLTLFLRSNNLYAQSNYGVPNAAAPREPAATESTSVTPAGVVAAAAAAAGAAAVVRNVVGTIKDSLDIRKHARDSAERRKKAGDDNT